MYSWTGGVWCSHFHVWCSWQVRYRITRQSQSLLFRIPPRWTSRGTKSRRVRGAESRGGRGVTSYRAARDEIQTPPRRRRGTEEGAGARSGSSSNGGGPEAAGGREPARVEWTPLGSCAWFESDTGAGAGHWRLVLQRPLCAVWDVHNNSREKNNLKQDVDMV